LYSNIFSFFLSKMDFIEGSSKWLYHSCLESGGVCEMLADDVEAAEDLVKKLQVQLAAAKKSLDKLKAQEEAARLSHIENIQKYEEQLQKEQQLNLKQT